MIKYQLIGVRCADWEGTQQPGDGKLIAIIRPVNGGKRLSAVIDAAACSSWPACSKAICRYHNRDGVKRLDESEIADPPQGMGSLPWLDDNPPVRPNEKTNYDSANSLLTGAASRQDRQAAGDYYERGRSNAAYLKLLSGAHFDAADDFDEALFAWSQAARDASLAARRAHERGVKLDSRDSNARKEDWRGVQLTKEAGKASADAEAVESDPNHEGPARHLFGKPGAFHDTARRARAKAAFHHESLMRRTSDPEKRSHHETAARLHRQMELEHKAKADASPAASSSQFDGGAVHFDASDYNRRIAEIDARILQNEVALDQQRQDAVAQMRRTGHELTEIMLGLPDAASTLDEHKRLLSLTPLGQSVLRDRERGIRPADFSTTRH